VVRFPFPGAGPALEQVRADAAAGLAGWLCERLAVESLTKPGEF
jgi:hypothetical protein